MKSAQLIDRAGITHRQLDHWTRIGYLEASGAGSGHDRDYSNTEAKVAERMARLTAAGLTPAAAARVARGEQPGGGVLILIVGEDE